MPLLLRLVLGSLLVLAGVALLTIAVLGTRSGLHRNRWAGVRTAASLRSDTAFTVANRVAAAPIAAAGAVGLVGGAALLAGPTAAVSWMVLALSAVGVLVLTGVGGVVGDRAAAAVPPPAPAPSACAGSCLGCDLVAGCRDGVAAVPQGSGKPHSGPVKP